MANSTELARITRPISWHGESCSIRGDGLDVLVLKPRIPSPLFLLLRLMTFVVSAGVFVGVLVLLILLQKGSKPMDTDSSGFMLVGAFWCAIAGAAAYFTYVGLQSALHHWCKGETVRLLWRDLQHVSGWEGGEGELFVQMRFESGVCLKIPGVRDRRALRDALESISADVRGLRKVCEKC